MRNENYYTVQGWMRTELGLTGNELLCYAIIYGFCQDEESKFVGTTKYLSDWIGCTRETTTKILKNLTDKNLIVKTQREKTNVFAYSVNYDLLKNLTTSVKNVHTPCEKTSQSPCEEISHSLIDNNIINNNINNNILFWQVSTPEAFDTKVVELWNSIAEKYHLAKISMVTPARHKALLQRMKELHIQDVEELFSKIRQAVKESPFLRGKQYVKTPNGEIECHNRDWICHFDFFLQQSSLLKALEGGYADPDLIQR